MANSKPHSKLTAEMLRSLVSYDPETGVFRSKVAKPRVKVGDVLGSVNGNGYVQFMLAGRNYRAHRLAWLYVYGEWPSSLLDHINRDKTDNRIDNLRLAENHENCRNLGTSVRNTSGHRGVMWYKRHQKWTASIRVNRKLIHLGYFAEKNDAISARLAAERKYYGEFAPQAA